VINVETNNKYYENMGAVDLPDKVIEIHHSGHVYYESEENGINIKEISREEVLDHIKALIKTALPKDTSKHYMFLRNTIYSFIESTVETKYFKHYNPKVVWYKIVRQSDANQDEFVRLGYLTHTKETAELLTDACVEIIMKL